MKFSQWYELFIYCIDILKKGNSKYDGFKAINELLSLITLKIVENKIVEKNNIQNIQNDHNEQNVEDEQNVKDEQNNVIKIGLYCKMTFLHDKFCKQKHMKDKNKANDLFDLLYNGKDCIFMRFNKYINKLTNIDNNDIKLTSFNQSQASDIQKIVKKIHNDMINIDVNNLNYEDFNKAFEKIISEIISEKLNKNSTSLKKINYYNQYIDQKCSINYIITELNIKKTDLCYDPICGTGDFLLEFSNVMKKNQKFIESNIFGQNFMDDILIHKILYFKIFAFGIESSTHNISKGNFIDSLYHENITNKFDIVCTNIPHNTKYVNTINKYNVKSKNSIALFLQHIYFSLKKDGKAGVILDQSFLTDGNNIQNSWRKILRKFLLEKTSISKIIKLSPENSKHTNNNSIIMFFTKGNSTTSITYINGYFKNNKQLIIKEKKILYFNDIKNKNYSLNWDDYLNVNKKQGSNLIKLGEFVELNYGKTPKKDTEFWNGEHKWIQYSELNRNIINDTKEKITKEGIDSCSIKLIEKNSVLMSFKLNTNIGKTAMTGDIMYCDNNIVFFKHSEFVTNKLLFYYLNFIDISSKLTVQTQTQTQTQTKILLHNLEVPNLSLLHQENIVKVLDKIYNEKYDINDTNKYYKKYPIFNLLIDNKYDQFKKIIELQDNLKILIKEIEFIKEKKLLQIQGFFNSVSVVYNTGEMKLGDICKIKFGNVCKINSDKHNLLIKNVGLQYINVENIDDINNKKYDLPYINDDTFEYIKNDTVNKNDLIISCVGTIGKLTIIPNELDGVNLSKKCVKLTINNENVDVNYLLKFLSCNINKLTKIGKSENIGIYQIQELLIPIPTLQIQKKIIEKIEQLDLKTAHYNVYAQILQNEINNIYEIIENLCKMKNNSNDSNNSNNLEFVNTLEIESINYNNTFELSNNISKSIFNEKNIESKINILNTDLKSTIKENAIIKMKFDLNCDLDTEKSQFNKLGISKEKLIKINVKTEDSYVYWYYPETKQIYSYNTIKLKWKIDKKHLNDYFEAEIEQIEKNLKKSKNISKKKIVKVSDDIDLDLESVQVQDPESEQNNNIEYKIKKNKSKFL